MKNKKINSVISGFHYQDQNLQDFRIFGIIETIGLTHGNFCMLTAGG